MWKETVGGFGGGGVVLICLSVGPLSYHAIIDLKCVFCHRV